MRSPGRLAGTLVSTVAVLAVVGPVVGTVAGCGASRGANIGISDQPVPVGENTAAPDLSGVTLPSFVMPQIKGAVSEPNPRLTPGSVVNTNTTSVCAMSPRGARNRISWLTGQQVFTAYGHAPGTQHKYILNYLVPLDLGGGTDTANIWPASLRGTGFFQKVQTDHVLRALVCRRTLSLAQAQRDEESNWYAAWLRYVVATGSA
jgi:hypothetical protein